MIELRQYVDDDLPVLIAQNAPEMMEHLGGPETDEQLRKRHEKYVATAVSETTRMFTIRLPDGSRAGGIGYWERQWAGGTVWETGWAILPEFQGRGLASAAARLVVKRARAERRHRSLHAFPRVDNPASNATCRKAGFTLLGEVDLEYPPGHPIRCNDWAVELFAS